MNNTLKNSSSTLTMDISILRRTSEFGSFIHYPIYAISVGDTPLSNC